jgi:hypothetical protein
LRNRSRDAAERTAERRRREAEAPRLLAQVPDLSLLRLEIEERRDSHALPETAHVKRVVLEHAPALFVMPCMDRACRDGGHDVTAEVMHALHQKKTAFSGNDACAGQTGSAPCQRVLHYVATAEYGTKA